MRLRFVRGGRTFLEAHPDVVLLDPATQRGRWRQYLGIPGPLHLDIGMGKGKFLLETAARLPEAGCLGMDKYDAVVVRALQKWLEQPQPNVRLLRAEAHDLLSLFAPGELDRIYLNFSDPWPNKGHAKRRLTHPEHLARYRTLLAPGGEVHIKTDNRGLFEFTLQACNAFGMAFIDLSLDLHAQEPESNIRTEYETQWSAKGARIYRLVARFSA